MKKENIAKVEQAVKAAVSSAAGITAASYEGLNEEERVLFNKTASVNENLTLREIKERISTTRGKQIMTVKGLRRTGTLVAAQNAFDCRMEVYDNGFAVYRTSHETVLRMEYVGKVFCQGEQEIGIRNETVDLSEEGWGNAVMLCAEGRLDTEYEDKVEKTMVSISGNAHCGEDGEEGEDMELDAGVDIAADYEREEEKERNLSRLTDKQRRVVEMYVFEHKSQQEIADELNISQRAVSYHIDAALKKLEN